MQLLFSLKKSFFEQVKSTSVKARISLALTEYHDKNRRDFVTPRRVSIARRGILLRRTVLSEGGSLSLAITNALLPANHVRSFGEHLPCEGRRIAGRNPISRAELAQGFPIRA